MVVATLVQEIPVVPLFASQMLMDHGHFMVSHPGVLGVRNQKHREFMLEYHSMQLGSRNKPVLDHQLILAIFHHYLALPVVAGMYFSFFYNLISNHRYFFCIKIIIQLDGWELQTRKFDNVRPNYFKTRTTM